MTTPDPRLFEVLALPLDDAEQLREEEHQAASDQADALAAQMRNVPIDSPDFLSLSRRHLIALKAVRATRSRNAWLWAKGHRW